MSAPQTSVWAWGSTLADFHEADPAIMTGEVNQSMRPLVPTLIGLSREHCDRFIEAFIASGMLERRSRGVSTCTLYLNGTRTA